MKSNFYVHLLDDFKISVLTFNEKYLTVLPFPRRGIYDSKEFVVSDCLGIQIDSHRPLLAVLIRFVQRFPDLRFSGTGVANDKDRMPHSEKFLQLNYLKSETYR